MLIKIYYHDEKDLDTFGIFLNYIQQKITFEEVKKVKFLNVDDLKNNLSIFHKEFIFILISKEFMNYKFQIFYYF